MPFFLTKSGRRVEYPDNLPDHIVSQIMDQEDAQDSNWGKGVDQSVTGRISSTIESVMAGAPGAKDSFSGRAIDQQSPQAWKSSPDKSLLEKIRTPLFDFNKPENAWITKMPGMLPGADTTLFKGVMTSQTSPEAMAWLALTGGTSALKNLALKGGSAAATTILKLLRPVETAANTGYVAEGGYNASKAAFAPDEGQTLGSRLGQGAGGLLQMILGGVGAKYPMSKIEKPPIPPPVELPKPPPGPNTWSAGGRQLFPEPIGPQPLPNALPEALPFETSVGQSTNTSRGQMPSTMTATGTATMPVGPSPVAATVPNVTPTVNVAPIQPNVAPITPQPIKATYIGDMQGATSKIKLYNILEGGNELHPNKSTVSEGTLLEMGWKPEGEVTPPPMQSVQPITPINPTVGPRSTQLLAAGVGPALEAADPNDEMMSAESKAAIGLGGAVLAGRQALTSMRKGGKPPVFYSRLKEAIQRLPEQMSSGSAFNFLKKQPASSDEWAFTGLKDFLETIPQNVKISKAELNAFMDVNGLEVHEVQSGSPEAAALRAKLEGAAKKVAPVRDEKYTTTFDGNNPDSRKVMTRAIHADQVGNESSLDAYATKPGWFKNPDYSFAHDANAIPDSYREIYITWKPKAVGPYKDALHQLTDRNSPEFKAAQPTTLPNVSSHSTPEKNVVVWARFHDRMENGVKVRQVDEIQSDWGQKGDAKGYKGALTPEAQAAETSRQQMLWMLEDQLDGAKTNYLENTNLPYTNGNPHTITKDHIVNMIYDHPAVQKLVTSSPRGSDVVDGRVRTILQEATFRPNLVSTDPIVRAISGLPDAVNLVRKYQQYNIESGRIATERARLLTTASTSKQQPNMPFKKSTMGWDVLGMKRIIASAAEEGIDRVNFTTAKQQGQRWASQLQSIQKLKDGTYIGDVLGPDGELEKGIKLYPQQVEEAKHKLTNKLSDIYHSSRDPWGDLEAGKPLKFDVNAPNITGKGFFDFYDTKLVNWLNKYLGRFGGKVEEGQITRPPISNRPDWTNDIPEDELRQYMGPEVTDKPPHTERVWSFTIPPALKDQISTRGQELGFVGIQPLIKASSTLAGGIVGSTQGDTVPDRVQNAILGAGAGYLGGKYLSSFIKTPNAAIPAKMAELIKSQNEGLSGKHFSWSEPSKLPSEFADAALNTGKYIQRHFTDRITDLKSQINSTESIAQQANPTFKVAPKDNAYINASLTLGGAGGQISNRIAPYSELWGNIQKDGIETEVQAWLNFKAMGHSADVQALKVGQGVKGASAKLPLGYTTPELARDFATFEGAMDPVTKAKVQQAGQSFLNLNQQIFDEAHARGLVSDAAYTSIKGRVASSGDYVPMWREIERIGAPQGIANAGSILNLPRNFIRKLLGSERATKHPIAASMIRAEQIIREANRSEAAKSLWDMRSLNPEFESWIKPVQEVGANPDWTTISFFDHGIKQDFSVPNLIGANMNLALSNQTKLAGTLAGKVLGAFGATLRAAATIRNPYFALRNVPRDLQDYAMLGKGAKFSDILDPVKFNSEWREAYKQVWNETPEFKQFLEDKAGFSTMQRQLTPGMFMRIGPTPKTLSPAGIMKYITKIPDASENATKLMVYKRLRASGMDKVEAAYETRNFGGSPDFGKIGATSPELNLYFMFLNAQVQGITRLGRLIQDPAKLSAAIFASTMTAAGLTAYNNQFQDEDGVKSITRAKPSDTQNYFVLVNPFWTDTGEDGKQRFSFFKIPKGHVAKVLLNPIEDMMKSGADQTVQSGTQLALNTVSNILPGNFQLKEGDIGGSALRGAVASANPAGALPVEMLMDRQAAFDAPIEGKFKTMAKDAEGRYPAPSTTSPFVKELANAADKIPGADTLRLNRPKALQYMLERSGLKTGLTEIPYDIMDMVLNKYNKTKETAAPNFNESPTDFARSIPIASGFTKSVLATGADQTKRLQADDLYKLAASTSATVQTFNYLAKTNSKDEAIKFMTVGNNKQLIAANGLVQKTIANLSAIRSKIEQLKNSGNTPEIRAEIGKWHAKEALVLQQVSAALTKAGVIDSPNE